MKACECGSTRFDIVTNFRGYTTIEIDPETDDFEVEDTESGDGEWDESEPVVCRECGAMIPYAEWNAEEPEPLPEPELKAATTDDAVLVILGIEPEVQS